MTTNISLRDNLPKMFVEHFKFSFDQNLFIDDDWKPEGVTSQFIEDADTYHEHYFDRLDFLTLTDRCLNLAGINQDQNISVLDIGSGGGSSVLATAKLLPNAKVVASDISPQLLRKLMAFVDQHDDMRARVAAVNFDIHKRVFEDSQFDIVIGMAILHHLVNPLEALSNVVKSLKVGGKIILVEPLEGGHLALLALYDQLLSILQELNKGEDTLAALLKALRIDYQARMGVPTIQAWTPHLDDKWVFGEAYLGRLCCELGLTSVNIYPGQSNLDFIFEETFKSLLSVTGNANLELPAMVVAAIKAFDIGISADLKKRLCPTGIVVMTK